MKVLFLAGMFPNNENPYSGVFIYNQAAALKKRGIDVCVLYIDLRSVRRKRKWGLSKYKYNEIDVYQFAIPCGPLYRLYYFDINKFTVYAYNKVRKTEGDFDLIHAHFFDMGLAARRIHDKYNVPYIVTEHSTFLMEKNQNNEIKKHIAPAYQKAEKIIAVGSALQEKMKTYTNKNIKVVPNILPERFSYNPNIQKDPSNFQYIGIVGRLTKDKCVKRIDLLIEAFMKLSGSIDNIRLLICGEGPEMEKLKQLVKDNNFTEKIKFLGVIDNHELPGLLGKCDCFVLPSIKETFGVVYIEAAGCGLPVIAAESGGPYDIVEKHNGIIVKNNDVEDLQNAMAYIYNNRKQYNSSLISENIRKKFGEDAFCETMLNIYAEIKGCIK